MKTNLTQIKLGVSNLEESLKWYTEVLGFEINSCYPKENPVYYDFKGVGACFAIGLADGGKIHHGSNTNFKAENVDELWEQLKNKVNVIEPIWDTPWETRKFTIADPDGNELGFC